MYRLQKDESAHLHQFILHAALDLVEERIWETTSCNLKAPAIPPALRFQCRRPERHFRRWWTSSTTCW